MMMSAIDTSFRAALRRMAGRGRIATYKDKVSPHLELAAIMKVHDGQEALLFPDVDGHDVPVIGNFLSCRENCEAAFDLDFRGIRSLVGRALATPLPPEIMSASPAQEVVKTSSFDIRKMLPALHHAPSDSGRFITAGIVIVRDPSTGVYNASYHRLQIIGPDRTAVKLDFGRHLRAAFERAQAKGDKLPVAVCIGADLALHYTAATMGSQMPESADELAVAGGLAGRPLAICRGVSQDILVPAEAEFVLEGHMLPDETVMEGPFGEFPGLQAQAEPSPVLQLTAVTHRRQPIYHVINGFGRETVMLRKYVLEASLVKTLQSAVPIFKDVDMSAGGLHRFTAVIQVQKTLPQHDGLQRNAILAAFGTLKDLDLIIAVDEDIDIRDPNDVEYALAMRFDASRDIITIPGARGHEMVRAGKNGIRTKLGLDATVPFEEKDKYRRIEFLQVEKRNEKMSTNAELALSALKI